MKKRSFTRYDVHIDARYCADECSEKWHPCLITKISRKGIGVIFPALGPPPPGSLLTFTPSVAPDDESLKMQGVLKWIKNIEGSHAGGVELTRVVDEALWLHLIYFIRRPSAEQQVVDLKTMPDQRTLKKSVRPPPAKVVVPSAIDHIKSILTHKIL